MFFSFYFSSSDILPFQFITFTRQMQAKFEKYPYKRTRKAGDIQSVFLHIITPRGNRLIGAYRGYFFFELYRYLLYCTNVSQSENAAFV